MGPTNASREDGFPALFFERCWHIIRKDVMAFCLAILNEDSAQSAFVLGILISDNVLLAYEILHTFQQKRVGKKGYGGEICSEGLSTLMRLAMRDWLMRGAKASKSGPQISLLLFVNDCNLFGEANANGAGVLKSVLREYERCSGQCVNYDKSMIFYNSNTSEGGKEVFINAVLYAIPTYSIVCFLLPKTLCGELEGNLPSHTWKSVWAVRGLLQNGLCWRVGTGERISVREDVWIPGPLDIAKRILHISLEKEAHEDMIVWNGEPLGEFFMRSAYKLLQKVWAIWTNKNQLVHKGKKFSSKEIVDWVLSYISKMDGVEEQKHTISQVQAKWRPSLGSNVKINFDATFDIKQAKFGSRVVTRNASWEIVALKLTLHGAVPTPFAREAYTCLQVVLLEVHLGLESVTIKSDSMTIVKKCQLNTPGKSVIGAIIRDI
ncbi:LINE-1 reverse transcriptase isogeny [Gossypium australe]|uniref:LINE-1 reverse transcriptase isogeny n=1 Tax=Gossypium australe TaxID=47621 RepID=A0A5B6WQK2_9ROSI|nr:LINE-1 reverse transcriptase isogeny [Gossypium australe]